MSKVQPRTLSGFMELLPARQAQFDRMVEILRRTYGLYGFTPLDTPLIEASEVLLAKGGGETEKQIYRFMKGDTDLSLRFDLTVPLAKYVAQNYGHLTFPFRRFQIGKVYRGERAQRGRFREFYQADIDVIGDGKLDISNEAEIPSIIYKTFSTLGLKRFQIRVNNRKVLNGFYAMLDLTHKSGLIMRTVDKLEKIGAPQVKELLMGEEIGLTAQQAGEIILPQRLVHAYGHGVAEVQTPGLIDHGQTDAALPVEHAALQGVRRTGVDALSAFPAVQRFILRQKMRRRGQTRRVRQNLHMKTAANAANVGDGVCSLRKIRQTRKNRLHANFIPQRKPRKRPAFDQR